jgi:DNA replication protein DnaC
MAELVQAIENHSLPTFQTSFKCDLCEDKGWIWHEDEDGNKSVEKCSCKIAAEAENRIRYSGLGHILDSWTFEKFVASEPWQKQMILTGKKYVESINAGERPWMFIGGAVGSGKSHICTAVCGELLRTRFTVRYFQWLTDARRLKSFATEAEDYDDLLNRYRKTDVLYIDDLFKSKRNDSIGLNPSDADVRVAFELINGRYTEDKPVIITSEWLLTQDLMDIDEGTFSRVFSKSKGFVIEIGRDRARNYRLK